jgi:hypothetical protein
VMAMLVGNMDLIQQRNLTKTMSNSSYYMMGPWTVNNLLDLLVSSSLFTSTIVSAATLSFIDTSVRSKLIVLKERQEKRIQSPRMQTMAESPASLLSSQLQNSPSPSVSTYNCRSRSRSGSLSASLEPSLQLEPTTPTALVAWSPPSGRSASSSASSLIPLDGARARQEQDKLNQLLAVVDNGDADTIRDMVASLFKVAQTAKQKVRSNISGRSYWMVKAKTGSKELRETQKQLSEARMGIAYMGKRRKPGAIRFNLSTRGGYTMALARNVGHAGAHATAMMLDSDATRQVCCSWEMLLNSSIMCDIYDWQKQMGDNLKLAAGMTQNIDFRTFEIHTFRGDATNSSVLQSKKVQGCEVVSRYCYPVFGQQHADGDGNDIGGDDDGTNNDIFACVTERRAYADLQFLPHSLSGEAMHDVYIKQLRSVKCPTWMDPDLQTSRLPSHLTGFVMTSDMGPDQARCAIIIAKLTEYSLSIFFFHNNCFLHQLHLIVKRQLSLSPGGTGLFDFANATLYGFYVC